MDEDEAALAAEGVKTAAAAAAGGSSSRGGPAGPGPGSSRDAAAAAGGGQRSSKRKRVYEQHRPMSDINAGEACFVLLQDLGNSKWSACGMVRIG
jgi:hypothetical protein